MVMALALGACAGVGGTILYFHSIDGPGDAQAARLSLRASATAITNAAHEAVRPPSSAAAAVHGATLANSNAIAAASSTQGADSLPRDSKHSNDASYDFDSEMNSGHANIKKRFDTEPEDGEWAPTAQSTLRASVDALPGRSIAGSVEVECHMTLCSVTMAVDVPASQSSDDTAGVNLFMQNLQGEWPSKPPASDLFDNRDVMFTSDSAHGRMLVEMFIHRRHQGAGTLAHSA